MEKSTDRSELEKASAGSSPAENETGNRETAPQSAGNAPDTEDRIEDDGSAKRDPASHLRLWPVAAVGLVVDLWSKYYVFHHFDLKSGQSTEIIPYVLDFQLMLNRGALFGLGKGWTWVFIGASILALAFVAFLFSQSSYRRKSLHIALALVLAGALGNLYDRAFVITDVVTYDSAHQEDAEGRQTIVGLVTEKNEHAIIVGDYPDGERMKIIPRRLDPHIYQQGVVRDFLKIRLGPLNIWPWIFNVADVLLVVGVCLLLWNFWGDRKQEKSGEQSSPEGADRASPESAE
jgi:signal peptidase II